MNGSRTEAWREAGGLSGAGLRGVEPRHRAAARPPLGAGYPIIGVGGVMSAADALAKRAAGADLVQICTASSYQGPKLVTRAARALEVRG